jgi:hypothetical protein
MKLYENRREITLKDALTVLFTNNCPGTSIQYMISFDEVDRCILFGKGYNPIYNENAWTISSINGIVCFKNDNADAFLVELFNDSYMERNMFHVWEEVK